MSLQSARGVAARRSRDMYRKAARPRRRPRESRTATPAHWSRSIPDNVDTRGLDLTDLIGRNTALHAAAAAQHGVGWRTAASSRTSLLSVQRTSCSGVLRRPARSFDRGHDPASRPLCSSGRHRSTRSHTHHRTIPSRSCQWVHTATAPLPHARRTRLARS